MKITSVDVIKNGERDLMDAITAELDWGAVEKIFRERHNLTLEEDIEYRKGDIVVHNDQVAYRLDFVAKVTLSVILDRDGNHVSINISGHQDATHEIVKDAAVIGKGDQSAHEVEGYERVLSEIGQEEQNPELNSGQELQSSASSPGEAAGHSSGTSESSSSGKTMEAGT